jgi:hypothetical protein
MAGRFSYRIFVVAELDRIVVFRFLHAAPHDREWKSNTSGLN